MAIVRYQLVGKSKNTSKATVTRLLKRAQDMHKHNLGVWYGYVGCYLREAGMGTGTELIAVFNK